MNSTIRRALLALFAAVSIVACATAQDSHPFQVTPIATFDRPWAMAFLPDGRLLVTEKKGRLLIVTQDGEMSAPVTGVPAVDYGGQGGLGDVALHPDYETNGMIYLSYVESGENDTRGAAVIRAKLTGSDGAGELSEVEIIWRQVPKVTGQGHFGHRLLFSADGHLYISSGERQKFDPAQDMHGNLGKIVRVNPDGSVPDDNPYYDQGGITAQIWSLGHRNPLGVAFDAKGQLWNVEMGPRGGDELNRVIRAENYGYPIVSNGRHYSGIDISDHDTRDDFREPSVWWASVISPSSFIIYTADLFDDWTNNGFITGLSSEALIRIEFDGEGAREVERYDMGERIRAVAQGPNGALWLLEDGSSGRLLRLTP